MKWQFLADVTCFYSAVLMNANERGSHICLILSFCFICYIIYASHRSLCCFLIIYGCRNTPLRQIRNVQNQFCVFFHCFAQLYFNFFSSDVKASAKNVRTSRKAPIMLFSNHVVLHLLLSYCQCEWIFLKIMNTKGWKKNNAL